MNCTDARQAIDALSETAAAGGELGEHLRDCELCRHYYGDVLLRRELAELQVPEPEPDVLQRAVRRASTERPARRWYQPAAVAASLLVVGLAALLVQVPERSVDGGPGAVIEQQPVADLHREPFHREEVRVVIHSSEDREDAELSIELAGDLELEGHSGRRTLRWNTSLKKGANLLVLPVLLRNDGGEVRIASRFGDSSHEIKVSVARQRDPLSWLPEKVRADSRTI